MRNIRSPFASAVMPAAAIAVLSLTGWGLADEAGTPVPIIKQWQGAYSAQDKPKREIVRDVKGWESLWRAMKGKRVPLPELPEVDFQKHMVIGAFMGSRSTGGYSVHITRIEQNDKIVVTVRETAPGPGDMVTMALTAPYHVVLVPHSEKPVEFTGPRVKTGPRPPALDR
jgi:hypothetical protein